MDLISTHGPSIYRISVRVLIPAQLVRYMDLRRSVLRIKLQLIDATGNPFAKNNYVAFVDLCKHSIFLQVDCYLQQM